MYPSALIEIRFSRPPSSADESVFKILNVSVHYGAALKIISETFYVLKVVPVPSFTTLRSTFVPGSVRYIFKVGHKSAIMISL